MTVQQKKPEVEFDQSRMAWDAAEVKGVDADGNVVSASDAAIANADFTSGFSVGRPFWHDLGNELTEHPKSTEEALVQGGADWKVLQIPVPVPKITLPDGTSIPGSHDNETHVYNYRSDTGARLALVGKGYTPLDNEVAFACAEELLEGGELLAETLVVLGNGARVILLCRLPDSIMIGNDPNEVVDPFLALANDHTGNASFMVYTTDVRVSCKNTARMSIAGAPNIWRGRHTKGLPFRTDEMKQVVGLSANYYQLFAETAEKMLTKKMGPKLSTDFLTQLVPLPKPKLNSEKQPDRTIENRLKVRALIKEIHDGTAPKIGDFDPASGENIRGTAWGWFNAVSAYSNHYHLPRGYNSDDPAIVRAASERRFYRTVAQSEILTRANELLVPTLI